VLGVDSPQAAGLLERAHAGFAEALGLPLEESDALAANWLWADPPAALWDSVYKNFHQTVWRRLQDEAPVLSVAAEPVAANEQPTMVVPAAAAAAATPRRRRPRNLRVWAALVAPLILVAGAYAYQQSQHGPSAPAHKAGTAAAIGMTPGYSSPVDDSQAPASDIESADEPKQDVDPLAAAAKRKKPLTPKELDALRLQELKALRKYEMEQTDKRLSKAQRDYAAGKAGELRDLARQRAEAKAQRRELARRERLQAKRERELAKRQAEKDPSSGDDNETVTIVEPGSRTQSPKQGSGGGDPGSGSGETQTEPSPSGQNQADQQCLQDADSGQYICQTP